MSISTVITMGYGTFAGIKFVPTIGYLSSNAPPVVTQVFQPGTKGRKTNKILYEKYPDFEPSNQHEIELLLLTL